MTGRPDQRDAGYMDPLMYSPVSGLAVVVR